MGFLRCGLIINNYKVTDRLFGAANRIWFISHGIKITPIKNFFSYFTVENHYSVVGSRIVSHKNAKWHLPLWSWQYSLIYRICLSQVTQYCRIYCCKTETENVAPRPRCYSLQSNLKVNIHSLLSSCQNVLSANPNWKFPVITKDSSFMMLFTRPSSIFIKIDIYVTTSFWPFPFRLSR